MLEEAIARDPNFVLAYCEMAKWEDEMYFARSAAPPDVVATTLTVDRRSVAEEALEKARKPDCRTAYKDLGLLAAVPLIANEFGEGSCRW